MSGTAPKLRPDEPLNLAAFVELGRKRFDPQDQSKAIGRFRPLVERRAQDWMHAGYQPTEALDQSMREIAGRFAKGDEAVAHYMLGGDDTAEGVFAGGQRATPLSYPDDLGLGELLDIPREQFVDRTPDQLADPAHWQRAEERGWKDYLYDYVLDPLQRGAAAIPQWGLVEPVVGIHNLFTGDGSDWESPNLAAHARTLAKKYSPEWMGGGEKGDYEKSYRRMLARMAGMDEGKSAPAKILLGAAEMAGSIQGTFRGVGTTGLGNIGVSQRIFGTGAVVGEKLLGGVAAAATKSIATKVLNGKAPKIVEMLANAAPKVTGGAVGFGGLEFLRTHTDPETGQQADLGDRLAVASISALVWPAFEVAGAAGRWAYGKIASGPQGEQLRTAISKWAKKTGFMVRPGEAPEQMTARGMNEWIKAGRPGGPRLSWRNILGRAAEAGIEGAGFSMIDTEFRKELVLAAGLGVGENGRALTSEERVKHLWSAVEKLATNQLAVLGMKAGGKITDIVRWQRRQPSAPEVEPLKAAGERGAEVNAEAKQADVERKLREADLLNPDEALQAGIDRINREFDDWLANDNRNKAEPVQGLPGGAETGPQGEILPRPVQETPQAERARAFEQSQKIDEVAAAEIGDQGRGIEAAKRRLDQILEESAQPTEPQVVPGNLNRLGWHPVDGRVEMTDAPHLNYTVRGDEVRPSPQLREALGIEEVVSLETFEAGLEAASLSNAMRAKVMLPGQPITVDGTNAIRGTDAEDGKLVRMSLGGKVEEKPLAPEGKWRPAGDDVATRAPDPIPPSQTAVVLRLKELAQAVAAQRPMKPPLEQLLDDCGAVLATVSMERDPGVYDAVTALSKGVLSRELVSNPEKATTELAHMLTTKDSSVVMGDLAAEAAVQAQAQAKQPFEVTKGEFLGETKGSERASRANRHKASVRKAAKEGVALRPEVAADYPEYSAPGKDAAREPSSEIVRAFEAVAEAPVPEANDRESVNRRADEMIAARKKKSPKNAKEAEIREARQKAGRARVAQARKPKESDDLLTALAKAGGLDMKTAAELGITVDSEGAKTFGSDPSTWYMRTFKKNGAIQGTDRYAQWMRNHGFLTPRSSEAEYYSSSKENNDVQEATDLLDSAMSGTKVYTRDYADKTEPERERIAMEELQAEKDAYFREQAAKAPRVEGEMEALDINERLKSPYANEMANLVRRLDALGENGEAFLDEFLKNNTDSVEEALQLLKQEVTDAEVRSGRVRGASEGLLEGPGGERLAPPEGPFAGGEVGGSFGITPAQGRAVKAGAIVVLKAVAEVASRASRWFSTQYVQRLRSLGAPEVAKEGQRIIDQHLEYRARIDNEKADLLKKLNKPTKAVKELRESVPDPEGRGFGYSKMQATLDARIREEIGFNPEVELSPEALAIASEAHAFTVSTGRLIEDAGGRVLNRRELSDRGRAALEAGEGKDFEEVQGIAGSETDQEALRKMPAWAVQSPLFTADPNRWVMVRYMTPEVKDALLMQRGPDYERFVEIMSELTGKDIQQVKREFHESRGLIQRDAAEFARQWPVMPSWMKVGNGPAGGRVQILETRPFEYVKTLGDRTPARAAFIKVRGQDEPYVSLPTDAKNARAPGAEAEDFNDGLPVPSRKYVNEVLAQHGYEVAAETAALFRIVNGMPVSRPLGLVAPGTAAYKMVRAYQGVAAMWRGSKLTTTGLFNLVEPTGAPAQNLGLKNMHAGIQEVAQRMLKGELLDMAREQSAEGVTTRDPRNWNADAGNVPEQIERMGRVVGQTLATPTHVMQEGLELALGHAVKATVQDMQEGRGTWANKNWLQGMGFEKAEAEAMIAGRGTAEQYTRVLRTGVGWLAGGSTKVGAQHSAAQHNRFFRGIVAFQDFAIARWNHLHQTTASLYRAIEARDAVEGAHQFGNLMNLMLWSTVSGVAGQNLMAAWRDGLPGVAQWWREFLEDPGHGMELAVVSTLFGGVAGALVTSDNMTDLLRSVVPWQVFVDSTQFARAAIDPASLPSDHKYAGSTSRADVLGKFLQEQSPITKQLSRGLFGMSAIAITEDPEIMGAQNAWWRWFRKEGLLGNQGTFGEEAETDRTFRMAMMNVVKEVRAGRMGKSPELFRYMGAAAGVKSWESVHDSLLQKRLMKKQSYTKLTPERQADLRKALGQDNWRRIAQYDLMLEVLADWAKD